MRKFIFLFFLFAQVSLLHAQINKGELPTSGLITALTQPGEKHLYTLKLAKDQFVFCQLIQKGVDVTVTTYDRDGNEMDFFDSPNGNHGSESFSLTSSKKGKYTIEIAAYDENVSSGYYELNIETIGPKATSPNRQVDELFMELDNDSTPGAAVSVVKNGEIIYKQAYGLANLEYDIPISTSSTFNVGSVSKQFTVFAILLLEKQGRLNLDDDIRKYVPEVPDFGETITLRHLASHTSGLRDERTLLYMAGWIWDDVITNEQSLKMVVKQKELNFNPGEEHMYCNTGFMLLAEVVTRVTGMSFSEFTSKYIFQPLEMKNSFFFDDHSKIVKNRTYAYHTSSEGLKKQVFSNETVGLTNLFTTVEDLSIWTSNFSDPKIGDPKIINKMNTPVTLNNGKSYDWALGQFLGEYKGLNLIKHGGEAGSYHTHVVRFPEQDFAVIVCCNLAHVDVAEKAYRIADIFLKDELKEEVLPNDDTLSTEEQNMLETYTGYFELQSENDVTIDISLIDGQLFCRETTDPFYTPMTKISMTEFYVEKFDCKIEIIANQGKSVERIRLHQGGDVAEAHRAEEFDKSSVNLSEFTGNFYSEELSTSYKFVVKDNQLIAQHRRLSDFNLYPLEKDVFTDEYGLFNTVRFIKNDDHEITGLRVSSSRVSNLYFKKID